MSEQTRTDAEPGAVAAPDGPSADPTADLPATARRGRRGGILPWLGVTAVLFVLLGAWALATPPGGSPDEPAHVFRAASVVRGQLLGPSTVDASGATIGVVEVPAGLDALADRVGCYALRADVPAACGVVPAGTVEDHRLVEVQTGAYRYDPVYYALVGWPSWWLDGASAVLAMRLVSAALVAMLLASAALTLARGRHGRLLLAAWAVAVTPMVVFLGGMVNPNGVEIAGALLLWAALLRLLVPALSVAGPGQPVERDRDTGRDTDRDTGRLLRRAAVGGSLMVLTRSLSPLWLVVIVLVALALSSRPALGALVRRRGTWVAVAVLALSTAAALAWTVLTGVGDVPDVFPGPDLNLLGSVLAVLPRLGQFQADLVGLFGWTDTPAPGVVVAVWALLAGAFLVAGWVLGLRRDAVVLTVLLGIVVGLPVVLEALQYNHLGPFWQARYILPLAVGLPLVAGCALARRASGPSDADLPVRGAVLVALGTAGGQGLAFLQSLIRNQNGLDSTLNPLVGPWHPAAGTKTVILLAAVGALALAAVVVVLPRLVAVRVPRDGAVPTADGPAPEVEEPPAAPPTVPATATTGDDGPMPSTPSYRSPEGEPGRPARTPSSAGRTA